MMQLVVLTARIAGIQNHEKTVMIVALTVDTMSRPESASQ